MRWDRIAGAILGMAMLASVFLLPFSSALSIYDNVPDTMYNIFRFFTDNFGSVQATPLDSLSLIAYLYLTGTILTILAGVLGTFSLPSGLLGLSGISLTAIAGGLSPGYSPYPIVYGLSFYLLLGMCFAQLGLWFWWRRQSGRAKIQQPSIPHDGSVAV